jgi:quercetin dioxygenase-like cupin family protein
MTNQNIAFHLPADTGPSYWGPGDRYTFLVTGAQTSGAYFSMEATIPPGGGPPPHIHHREEESFYLLEGTLDITPGEKKLRATTGDFVQIPRGTVHAFLNAGSTTSALPGAIGYFARKAAGPVTPSGETPVSRRRQGHPGPRRTNTGSVLGWRIR